MPPHRPPRSARFLILVLVWMAAALGPQAAAAQTPSRLSAPTSGATLPVLLPLAGDAAGLAGLASAVSTPGSPDYGHYLSVRALSARYGAGPGARARVVAFLRHAGASDVRVDATGLFVTATLRVATAERLFGTSLHAVHGPRASVYAVPASVPRIPAALRGIVTGVVGLDTQPLALDPTVARPAGPIAPDDVSGSGYSGPTGTPRGCRSALRVRGFAPNQYSQAYGLGTLARAGLQGQGERVALIEIDGFKPTDIRVFARCFGLRLPTIDVFGVGSVTKPLAASGEATLDLEVVDAAAPRLRSVDVYETRDSATSVLEGLTAPLQNPGYVPQVISASLGLCERQFVDSIGRAGLAAAEESLEEAAAAGVSVLAASGDSGSSDCLDDYGDPVQRLDVNYPASSPFVTAVGGTNLRLTSANQIASATVWHDGPALGEGASGGGESAFFARPAYQDGTVTTPGRVLPDVALLADVQPGYDIYCTAPYSADTNPDGCVSKQVPEAWQPIGGTSASTPLMAAGLALVDEDLQRHGRVAVGFANPLLYGIGRSTAAGSVFQDVLTGDNDVTGVGCCSAGPGFDAASGFGGVSLSGLASVAVALEPTIPAVTLGLPRGQRALHAKRIVATVACSAACDAGALATVTVGGRRIFSLASKVSVLKAAGTKSIAVTFSRAQLTRLLADAHQHKRMTASVRGAVVDGGGNVERETAPQTLALRS